MMRGSEGSRSGSSFLKLNISIRPVFQYRKTQDTLLLLGPFGYPKQKPGLILKSEHPGIEQAFYFHA